MTPTLKELADRLEISTATVSRVLNGKPGVSAEMRGKVLAVARELNYIPNPAATALATSKSFAVAFVIKRRLLGVENPFYDRIMMGVEEELEKHGYHLISTTIDEERPIHKRIPPAIDSRRADGLIITGCELSPQTMVSLQALGMPTVLAANLPDHNRMDTVTSDNFEGGYIATKHLIDHGHQKIVFICGPTEWSPVCERLYGYQKAVQEANLAEYVIYREDLEIESGYSAVEEILEMDSQVTAVFGSNDPIAIGVMQAARDNGLSIPNDLAVIGFDNIPWSENTVPPLTTIYIHKEQIGILAAKRLLDLIENPEQSPIITRVANELVVRQSCGCEPNGANSSKLNGIGYEDNLV